ncbi:NAK protein kinase [Gaeumannomyces tritici R3-111a-1]|uniref:non-specific serine/threonine protein kinase n=1 Tax=Gaeumannomyces tritici (strain R3-111a-1) TaxID=644352 RepID=J3NKH6_GAET3|nr:NAK protein kinase [Gaeumannomyces tritici R3-111a-1]EJT81793.1 NAK protein kinase [Gaeumannomyces tritici R3-111a-1]
MASSYGHGQPAAHGAPGHHGGPGAAPAGTFTPGTKIQVGGHRVVIQKYLSEGGFAHVYLVKLQQAVSGTDLAVLKRVAVPDKEALRGMRTEVETMKRLKGHRAIVTYMDSHASELQGGGYEVFLLMEFCDGGGLIDFMNTRLQHRLTEPEILGIFTDVAEGVACMHYLKPPLLHRDLKVENVLITTHSGARKFKLCDFGSAAPRRPAPTTVVECRLMDEDVQKHTTLQYRSPEMIDVYRKQPIDEKSDIWALGVLLYKLCYYTTPFEDQGQLAILNASFKYPAYPVFSDRLKRLIGSMLKESQDARPNIYQVLREGCSMQGREVPIKDIYSGKPRPEAHAGAKPPAIVDKPLPAPVVGASFAAAPKPQQAIPEVVPMRRGRPQQSTASQPAAPKPSPSPMRATNDDPFAALDSKSSSLPKPGASVGKSADELSSRFPTLDQFSLLHDHGTTFNFDEQLMSPEAIRPKDLDQRVTERLADEVFAARSPSPPKPSLHGAKSDHSKPPMMSPPVQPASAPPRSTEISRASAIIAQTPELQALASPPLQAYSPPKPKPVMVSTGTMTGTPPGEKLQAQAPSYRYNTGDMHRSSSVPRMQDMNGSLQARAEVPPAQGSTTPRVSSFPSGTGHARQQSSSSRPSLEGGRPSADLLDPAYKTVAGSARPRPVSTHLESNLDYLREREREREWEQQRTISSPRLMDPTPSPRPGATEESNIASNVDFLRTMEETEKKKSGKHMKRSSLTALSGTKNILAGKFGDAFKRFETNTSGPPPARTPSPLKQMGRHDLTPIAGSEATDGRSDDGEVLEETDDMSPEMRREIERRRLSMEEKRVAAAGAEYRQRIALRDPTTGSSSATSLPKSIGGVSRATSIQNKVQSLLDESTKSTAQITRTAQGYGHFTEPPNVVGSDESGRIDGVARKPLASIPRLTGQQQQQPQQQPRQGGAGLAINSEPGFQGRIGSPLPVANKADPSATLTRPVPLMPSTSGRPAAPPKPVHLNKHLTSGGRPASPPKPAYLGNNINKPLPRGPPGSQLVAPSLPGQPALDMTVQERDDYLSDFQKRFPSLTSIEMVERDIRAEASDGRSRR